jgi:Ca-activated chloride channel family protein
MTARVYRLLGVVVFAITICCGGNATAGELWANFISPTDGEAVIGEILVEANVRSVRPIRDVVFFLDGRPVAMLTSAPYRLRLDLGEENRGHTMEVVATDVEGSVVRELITTKPATIGGAYEVELQQLYVTATSGGSRVLDLGQDEFTVEDEGRTQDLVTFAHGDIPFTAVLLIDASASMYGKKIEAARAGATAFVEGMRDLDRGKVIVFSDVVQNSTPFSGVHEVLTAGLTGATGQGGTAISDHLYIAFKLLERRQGRRVVILLSDGMDNHSALEMQQVLEHARRSQALMYWIQIEQSHGTGSGGHPHTVASAWRRPADYQRQFDLLAKAVLESGGRIIEVVSTEAIRPTFLDVLAELREQYALGYYPDNLDNDGRWHKIGVRIKRPGVDVRTHEGYVDY